MNKCRITVMRIAHYPDLIRQYENPISHACDLQEGQIFVANGWQKPEGLCQSAWDSMSPLRPGPLPRGEQPLRRLDEGSPLRHDLLQRRIPPGELPHRGAGGGGGLRPHSSMPQGRACFAAALSCRTV